MDLNFYLGQLVRARIPPPRFSEINRPWRRTKAISCTTSNKQYRWHWPLRQSVILAVDVGGSSATSMRMALFMDTVIFENWGIADILVRYWGAEISQGATTESAVHRPSDCFEMLAERTRL